MSNPDTAAAHVEFPEDEVTSTEEPTFDAADYEKQVVTACNNMEFDDDGKWQPPGEMSPEMQYAVNSERRRRDTESSYTKSRQALSAAERKNVAFLEKLEETVTPNLTVEQAEDLEDLKESDPEAWRAQLNEYDEAAYSEHLEDVEEIDSEASQGAEEVRRTAVLEQFHSDNPDVTLDDNVFNNDLPQRITGRLKEGEATFEEFLEEAKEFLLKGKKIAGSEEDPEKEPNFSASSGSSRPAADAVVKGAEDSKSYSNEIF